VEAYRVTSFRDCIVDGVAKGAISAELGEGALANYDDAFAEAAQTLAPEDADRAAGGAVMDALEKAAIEARRRQVLTIRNRRSILAGIANLKERRGYEGVQALGGRGDKPPPGLPGARWIQGGEPPREGPLKKGAVSAQALELLMRNRGGRSGGAFVSAEGQTLAVRGLLDAKMADVMEKFQTKLGFDSPNRAKLGNMVREAFGENTGDVAAKQLAEGWTAAAELARQQFNAAGGMIGKHENWGLPQMHDPAAIYRAGKARWISYITPLLDRAKMIDKLTGAPVTERRLTAPDGVLSRIYDRIVTKGLIDKEPPEHPGGGALALSRGEERYLTFKDATSWTAYQREFGQGDAYAAMLHHLDGMAQDIGLMRALGPNPAHQWTWLKAFATREAAVEQLNGVDGAEQKATSAIHIAQAMYEQVTGGIATVPVNRALAKGMANLRSFLNGVSLGSIALTEWPSAPFFGAMARSFMGIKGDLGLFFSLLNPLDGTMRKEARRMGFVNEAARDAMVGQTQSVLRSMTVGEQVEGGLNVISRKLPATVMRAQLLTPTFQARKTGWRMNFMGTLADIAGKTLAQLAEGEPLERALGAELTARGFSEADWAAIGATPVWTPRPGVRFLRPVDIADHAGPDLAMRVAEMVLNGEQYAVPVSSSLYTRARLLGGTRPGTAWGELVRSLAMYKTFVVNQHFQYSQEIFMRGIDQGLTGLGLRAYQARWYAGIVGALTIGGAVTLQLKRLRDGLDPQAVDNPRFWAAALLQGGALGPYGDFLFSDKARTDKGIGLTSAGPVSSPFSDAWNLTGQEAIDQMDRAQHPGRAHDQMASRVAHDLKAYTPNVWWERTVFNRLIVDQLEQAMDPDAKQRYAEAARKSQHATGGGEWWARGDLAPTRAPAMQTAIGQPPPQP
jgi:hypothetical protein